MVSVWRASAGTVGREDARTRSLGESKSRNKVSVGEPAEGSLTHSQHARCDLQTKKHTSKTSNETLPACSGGMKPTPRGSVRSNIFGVPTKKNLQKFCEFVVLDATHGDGLEPVRSPGRCGSKSGRLAGDRPDVRKKTHSSSPIRESRGTCALLARSCSMEARSPSLGRHAWAGAPNARFLAATVQRADRARVGRRPGSLFFFILSHIKIFIWPIKKSGGRLHLLLCLPTTNE